MSEPQCSDSPAPTVLIYREELLYPSEPFVLSHGARLSHYRAQVACREIVCPDAALDKLEVSILQPAATRWSRARFRLRGPNRTEAGRVVMSGGLAPKLVHAHFGPDGLQAGNLSKAWKAPMVVTFHGFDATWSRLALARSGLRGMRLAFQRRALIRRSDLIHVPSKFMFDRLIALGADEHKTRVRPVGVDIDYFTPGELYNPNGYLLFVGRLVESKGLRTLLLALTLLNDSGLTVPLHIVGDGPLRTEFENVADQAGLATIFHGRRSRREVRDLMRGARLLVAPSQDHPFPAEAFGLSLIEAQACGLPVIATRVGGIPETLLDGVTGTLCEASHRELARTLAVMWPDSIRLVEMSSQARLHAVSRFSMEDCARAVETDYDELIGRL